MRLKQRLLLLFAAFAVLPLLAMGAFDYASSLRHLEAVLTVQTESIADQAARELKDRLELQASDIGLLSENRETQHLLRTLLAADSVSIDAARTAAAGYWQELWQTMRFGYDRVVLYDAAGRSVMDLSSATDTLPIRGSQALAQGREIRDLETGKVMGRLEFSARIADLFQSPIFRSAFGTAGQTLVIDRDAGRIVLEPSGNTNFQGEPPFAMGLLDGPRGTFRYHAGGERRVASFVSFDHPDWALVVTASVDEFAQPFIQLRSFDLALLLGVVLAVSIGFFLLLRRATASLDRITVAADRVGRGDFDPALPPAGSDEVGRLSAAFGLMTNRIREMIAQVETSRQMGVLGRFAAELSHEIRNPLTAIKINLQGLERDAREGRIPDGSRQSVDLALREIRRLDLAVKAALKTGRPPAEPRPFQVHAVLGDTVEFIRPQAAAQGVVIHCDLAATDSRVSGDAESIRGALLNLLLNAIEAMPAGGNLWLISASTKMEGAAMIELRVRDEGSGIPDEIRNRVFRPFFTTKEQGTGLGLSMALHAIVAQGGTLTLGEPAGKGTEFIIHLPLLAPRGAA